MKRNICILSALLVLASSCVYSFEPKGVKSHEGILVVEGDINLSDESYFVLSLSVDVSKTRPQSVTASELYVEAEEGARYSSVVSSVEDKHYIGNQKHTYTVDTKSLNTNTRYRLVVRYGEKEYASNWESPRNTPPIDSVSYEIVDSPYAGKQLSISVSTTGVQDSLKYYKWDYSEDWEYTANMFATSYYDPYYKIVLNLPFESNKYYCWKKDRSSGINVFSTETLSENKVSNHEILSLSNDDDRISYLYSIEVLQKSISREAYIYWETLLKNNDGTGGVFSPQPSELRGNITCIEDPDEPVLGYVSVYSGQKKRIFIKNSDIQFYYKKVKCEYKEIDTLDWWVYYYHYGWDAVFVDDMTQQVTWAEASCVDCRKRGGTKNRPDFWPAENKDI